ncbi:PhoPQ-regulated protein [Salmonella enterica]|nr:PhoPQ-regulated protein [Salmonella enterica]
MVKCEENMKKIYLVIILVLFISTNIYTQLHNNIFFCRNSLECDLSHVLPDYREHISDTPLKYTLISTEPLAQVELRHYELLSQHWSPDDMVTPAQWRHNVDIYIPETAKQRHALVVVNNGVNYEEGVQINSKPVDFTQETLASIARDTNTIVISVSDIPNQYLTFQDDKKPLKEDESVSRSWALFMEAPEQRKLMPLNIPMVSSLSQAIRLAKEELTRWNIHSFIVTGISKRGWTAWLSAIADPDVEAIVPFAIDLLDIDASLEHIYQSYGGNWPITFYPYYQQGIDEKIKTHSFSQLRQIIDPLRYLNTVYQPRLAIPKYIINASGDDFFVPDNFAQEVLAQWGITASSAALPTERLNHYSLCMERYEDERPDAQSACRIGDIRVLQREKS